VGCGSAAGASGGSLQLLELPLGSAAGERQQGEQQGSRRRGASAGRGGAVQRPNEAAVQVRGILHRQRSVLLPSSCRDTLEPAVTFPRRAPDVDEAATNPWSRGRPRTFTSPERFRRVSREGGSRGGAGRRREVGWWDGPARAATALAGCGGAGPRERTDGGCDGPRWVRRCWRCWVRRCWSAGADGRWAQRREK